MPFQKTIRNIVQFKGIGLHTGKQTEVIVKPAPENYGIVFVRTDGSRKIYIPALSQYVVDTTMSTVLGKSGVTIATVEHLMAALWGLDIDNVEIEVNGPEIPIMDGSAFPFVKKIKKTGIIELGQMQRVLVITRPVSIMDGDRYCSLGKSRFLKLSCSIHFSHPLIQNQKLEMKFNSQDFIEKVSKARTFGFLKDVEMLRTKGLIAGGALENAIVLDDEAILNPEGLRFKDEFVRHKMLDSVGDMALLGVRLVGHWMSHKAGHEIHYKLIRKILTEPCGYLVGYTPQESLKQAEIFKSFAHQPASI